MAGKDWVSETTLDDTMKTNEQFNMVPLYNLGLPGAGFCEPSLAFQVKESQRGDTRRKTLIELNTPVGTLYQEMLEDIRMGVTPTRFPITDEDGLAVLDWYLDRSLEIDLSPLTAYI